MKSGEQIKGYIATAMRQYGGTPKALLHVLAGYIEQLQDEMKRETEDTFADRNCNQRHPGRAATGVYCKLCHDAEMAGRFGSIPGGVPKGMGDLVFPGDDAAARVPPDVDDPDDLDDVGIAPLPPEKV